VQPLRDKDRQCFEIKQLLKQLLSDSKKTQGRLLKQLLTDFLHFRLNFIIILLAFLKCLTQFVWKEVWFLEKDLSPSARTAAINIWKREMVQGNFIPCDAVRVSDVAP
jgi:hypothetical protein